MHIFFYYRQEARDIIRNAVNASEDDAVIFAGHGCLGALQKLISALDFREPPVVFVFPSEHHDNIQLWQEVGAKVSRHIYFLIKSVMQYVSFFF